MGAKEVKCAIVDTVKEVSGITDSCVVLFGHETSLPVYTNLDPLDHVEIWTATGTPPAVFAIFLETLVTSGRAVATGLKT